MMLLVQQRVIVYNCACVLKTIGGCTLAILFFPPFLSLFLLFDVLSLLACIVRVHCPLIVEKFDFQFFLPFLFRTKPPHS